MTSAPYPVPPQPQPPLLTPGADRSRRERRHGVVRAALVVVTTFTAIGQVAFASNAADLGSSTAAHWWVGSSVLVALGAPYLLLVRRRPLLVAALTAVLTLVSAIDPLLALVALAGLVARRRDRSVLWCTALTTVATAVAYLRDIWRPVKGSVWKTIASPDSPVTASTPDLTVPTWTVVIVLVVTVGISVGAGLLLRTTGELAVTRAAREHDRQAISSERSRQHERDVVAREAHDTLGHQLSLLALHASALEATHEKQPEGVARLATQIRLLTTQTLRNVRGLVDLLDDPDPITTVEGRARTPDGHAIGLDQLPALLDEARRAGSVVTSSIYATDTVTLDPACSRAVYRIVQESLTNARKHAPGQHVDLTVVASPDTGIDITVTNPLPPGAGGPARSSVPLGPAADPSDPRGPGTATAGSSAGRGLRGIHDRVELLRGRVSHGVGPQGGFTLSVHLPWGPTSS